MRGARGRKGWGAKLCKSPRAEENHAKSFAKEFMQELGSPFSTRAGVRRIQTLRAFRRTIVPAIVLFAIPLS